MLVYYCTAGMAPPAGRPNKSFGRFRKKTRNSYGRDRKAERAVKKARLTADEDEATNLIGEDDDEVTTTIEIRIICERLFFI